MPLKLIRLPVKGEKCDSSLKYRHVASYNPRHRALAFRGFPIDALRYSRLSIHPDDLATVMKFFTDKAEPVEVVRLVRYDESKKGGFMPLDWATDIFSSDGWDFHSMLSTEKLASSLRFRQLAILRPVLADDQYGRPACNGRFPFDLMQEEQAYPFESADAGLVDRLMQPYVHPSIADIRPIVLMKYSQFDESHKHGGRSDWNFAKWDVSGWSLMPIAMIDVMAERKK